LSHSKEEKYHKVCISALVKKRKEEEEEEEEEE
jgi:hypothetical protein